jgi:hypothetical protein
LTKIGHGIETASLPEQFEAVSRTPGAPSPSEFTSLLAQVVGETAFHEDAVNKRTGAAGPFQFVKNTWLSMIQRHGQALGVKPSLIAQIKTDAKGHLSVADPKALKDILDLRHDVALASGMAEKLMAENTAHLHHLLHRAPSEPEVHLAFLLGAAGAGKLINAAASTPEIAATQVVASAAAANPTLFHDRSGKARSAAEAVAFLAAKYRADKAKVQAYAQTLTAQAAAHRKAAIDA